MKRAALFLIQDMYVLPFFQFLYRYCQLISPFWSGLEHDEPLANTRKDFLCNVWNPPSKYPAYLQVTDIAGLIKGASEGAGLGNAFLSHIQAVDGMYHVVRCARLGNLRNEAATYHYIGRLITMRFFMWMTPLILSATWVRISNRTDAGEIYANGVAVQIQSRASCVRRIWIFLPKLRSPKRRLCGRREENSRCCRYSTRRLLRLRRYVTIVS